MLDPIPALAFAAARTERIRLGTGIVILPLRNPVTLAKELATIDVLSRGRLMVGIGVGYVRGEYEAMGVPFNTRGRRADEYVDALRALWGDEQPSFHGDFVSFDGIQCRPQPMQRPGPPIHRERDVDRGATTRGRRVRRVGTASSSTSIAHGEAVDELARLHKEVDRPPRSRAARDHDHAASRSPIDVDTVRRFEDLGVHRLVLMRDFTDMAGGPDECVARRDPRRHDRRRPSDSAFPEERADGGHRRDRRDLRGRAPNR